MERPVFFKQGDRVGVLTTQPLDRVLDYIAPEGGVALGAFVEVPLGPRRVLGVVWGIGEGDFDAAKLKDVTRRLDVPPLRPDMLEFLERVAGYTMSPLSSVLRLATRAPGLGRPPARRVIYRLGPALPERLTDARRRVIEVLEQHGGLGFAPGDLSALAGVSPAVLKGLSDAGVLIREKQARDLPFQRPEHGRAGAVLTHDQKAAAHDLRMQVRSAEYATTLLKGVTGSGKTEVYLEAVAEALSRGRQALILLPEIALTMSFLARVEERFGVRPAEWHSGITQAERRRCWNGVATGDARLVIGARSALFLPFRELGVIVVDEEHDGSYKQEDGVLYHARDMAVLRASICSASVVLSSATPSLETWTNAEAGKYRRLDLPQRYGEAVLPEISSLDMRSEGPAPGEWISPPLADAVRDRLDKGEQSLLFLNRRGYAPLTLCRACGHQIGCKDCDARMVEHRFLARLMCHQCGATRAVPRTCPNCGAEDRLAAIGPGVERLAEETGRRFEGARVAVLSSDLAATAREMKARIEEIAGGGADIVIGTQIVAKGHNFPLLTLVGVIDADLGLQGGDLRAAEKTFQLIRQVSGRAGRADRPGVALVQTHQPEHPVIRAIVSDDEEAFWKAEAESRARAGAPPFGRMAGIVISGPDEKAVYDLGRALARAHAPLTGIGAQLLGPAPAPVARIRGRHRARMLVKAPKGAALQAALAAWRGQVKVPNGVRVTVDVDPQTFY